MFHKETQALSDFRVLLCHCDVIAFQISYPDLSESNISLMGCVCLNEGNICFKRKGGVT